MVERSGNTTPTNENEKYSDSCACRVVSERRKSFIFYWIHWTETWILSGAGITLNQSNDERRRGDEMRRDDKKPLTNEERDRHSPLFNLEVHLLTLSLFVLFMSIVALNQELKLRVNQRTQVCCLHKWRLHRDRCCVGDASLMWRTAAPCHKVWCFLASFLHPWPSMMTHAYAIAFTRLPLNSSCNGLAGFMRKREFKKKKITD